MENYNTTHTNNKEEGRVLYEATNKTASSTCSATEKHDEASTAANPSTGGRGSSPSEERHEQASTTSDSFSTSTGTFERLQTEMKRLQTENGFLRDEIGFLHDENQQQVLRRAELLESVQNNAAEHHTNVQQAGVILRDYVLAGNVIKVNDDLERAQTVEIAGKHGAPIYASGNLPRDRLPQSVNNLHFHCMRLHSSSTATCSSVESLRSLRVQLSGIKLGGTAMELDENGNVLHLPGYRNGIFPDEWRLCIRRGTYYPQTQTGMIALQMSEGRCQLMTSMVSISQVDFMALWPSAHTTIIHNRNLNGLSRYFENGGTLTFHSVYFVR
jgi:hypothetical protein